MNTEPTALCVTFARFEASAPSDREAAALRMLDASATAWPLGNAWVGGPVPRNTPIPEWDELLSRGMQAIWLSTEPLTAAPPSLAPEWQVSQRTYEPLLAKSLPQAAPYLCSVAMDVDPEHEEEFNAWYTDEHVHRISAVPGVMCTTRYRDTTSHPHYLALYHVEGPSTLMAPAYAEATETPWSFRVRRFMRGVTRHVYRPAAQLMRPGRRT